ncbi:restriction endonuclease subunit S [Limosilactobacillus reuteri]|uniref:restriction endonuclease subunit S n=1 Tax=Limosilactobacillus reuteri TaxID=1598 RepID=UPI00386CE877
MKKLGNYILLNPKENISKGKIARKIAMENLKPFTRDINTWSNISFNGGSKFRNGDTLLARITPCLENGKTAFVNILGDDEIAYGSTEFYVLRAVKNKMDPYYLYYLTISKKFRNTMIKAMTGTSGRQRVPKEAVLEYLMDVPDFESQKKIGEKLKVIDDKITLNNQINDNLLNFADKIFSKFLSVKDTELKLLSDVANIKAGGDKPKNISSVLTDMCSVPIFSNGISNNGLYGYTNESKINQQAVTVSARGTIGFVCLRETPYYPIVRLISAIPKGNITHRYLYLWLRKNNIQGYGTTQQQLTVPVFKKYPISILRDEKDIDELNEFINPIFDKIQQNNVENRKLVAIKKLMLKKYF